MAITSVQAVQLLVDLLRQSELASAITGSIEPKERPLDSQKEDVVVNAPVVNREAVQRGLLNVNIYTPNRTLYNGPLVDRNRPDMDRLIQLSNIIEPILADYVSPDGRVGFAIQDDVLHPDANHQHYLNLRVIFTALNV